MSEFLVIKLPDVGALVLDTATGKTGRFMGEWCGQAMLRPDGGGQEWSALPEQIIPVGEAA
jgi:hypothetical protein